MRRERTCLVFGIFVGLASACSLADLGSLSSGDDVADADVANEDATTPIGDTDTGALGEDAALDDSGDEDASRDDASGDGGDGGDDAGADMDAALDASDAASVDGGGDAGSDGGSTPCHGAPVKSTPFVKPQAAFNTSNASSSVDWNNEMNALTEDGQTANATSYMSAKSHYLVVTHFPFGVADSIRVVGVELQVVRRSQGVSTLPGNVADDVVGLAFKGVASAVLVKEPGIWSTTAATITYGGPTQTFGETITGADVNDLENFGAGISVVFTPPGGSVAIAKIDAIRMKLYYCE